MARNLKKEYIMNIVKMEVPNGYKFDLANYLHNPAYGFEYPTFIKAIAEDGETMTMRRVFYFKHWDGSGEYKEETYKVSKNGDTWQVVRERTEKVLEVSNRFNIKKLIAFC